MNQDIKILESNRVVSLTKVKRYSYLFTKRLFDIVCSIIGIIFLLPITIFIKLCYILTGDFNKIFYTQKKNRKIWQRI